MADLDELQIKITSSSKDAEDAISKLITGLNNLNNAIGQIDTSRINSFANAMTKLANIGNNTNTTAKALKSMSNEIASSFGIRTKKGIEDITLALQELYKSARNLNLNDSAENSDAYFRNIKNLQDAIEVNYKYKEAVDETTKAIHDYVKAQNQSGSKVAMADMAKEYGEDFKEVAKVLGKSFNNTLKSTEGATDLVKFFEDMNAALGTTFKVGNDQELKQSLDSLVGILQNAKDKVYDFSKAVANGLLTGEEAANSAYTVADRLFALIKEQDKYGASSGLGGITQVFREISNIQMPDMTGVAEATRNAQKATENIGSSAPRVEKVAKAADTVKESFVKAEQEVKVFRDSLNGLGNSKKIIEGASANAGDYTPVERGFISDIQATGNMKMLPAVIAQDMKMLPAVIGKSFEEITREAYEATRTVEEVAKAVEEPINLDSFKKAGKAIEDTGNSAEGAKEKIKELSMSDVLSNVMALGEGFEKLSHSFGNIADKGIGIFKKLTTPLKGLVDEYSEKFEKMSNTGKNFQKRFQARMTQLSQFWKRTMRTFTFMMVRKAIDAIVKEVGSAVQSLAMYSNAMGTAFNTDLSHMVADFQYLGRSIVSVFAPLLNFIVPIIDAITERIATLLSYIGMLFTALGGGTSFTKAKKNVGNYAESLDQASKSAKNLTMGIDELNILSENKGGGGSKPYDGWEDAWEEIEIPQWIKDISKGLKDFWKKFFDPLKTAWDRAKQYLIDGFKTMIDALQRMFGHIIDDFLTMWNQEKTIRMFEQILRIAGDLMRVVRNLANQFDKAWEKGKVGLKIFENLRDILAIIVDHVRNVSYYMIGWAKEIDFYPMLKSFEELTLKMKPLAEFIGGVFEDIMKEGVLKYIEFIIKDAIPHMNETLASILDTFSFNKLRENLRPVWDAIREMLENIHTGTTNAIGNLGREIARFTNSKDFTNFLETVIKLTRLITKERVEKVITGLGKGILNLAKSLVKFINSKPFMAFFEFIAKYIDGKSVDDIARALERLAAVIIGFKFAAFTTEKLAGFFKFWSIITAASNLGKIAKELGEVGKEMGVAAESASKFAGLKDGLFVAGKAVGVIATAFLEFKGVSDSVENLVQGTGNLAANIIKLAGSIALAAGGFTLLLGFPAGIIASGAVAAVGAIKGIADATEQINMDHIFDGVLAKGDLTIQQVKDWYNEVTFTVDEHINKWKDAERNLTQDRGDLEEYTRTLQEFSSVFESGANVTASMADTLLEKYENLQNAVNNYVNQSTDALVSNILAQKSFLEAQGIDVNQMIVDIYRSADETKQATSEAVQGLKEEVDKLGELKEGTQEYADQMSKVSDAVGNAAEVLAPYIDTFSNIDTSQAVEEIEKLGNSLNLSQYGGDWQAAGEDIKNHIQDVTSAYTSKMEELQSEADRLKEEIDLMPNVSESAKETAKMAIDQSFEEVSTELTDKTRDVLNFYSSSLATQMEGVATQAQSDWKTLNPLKKLWYGSEDSYILSQMELYSKKMLGQEGLAGAFSDGFKALGDEVDPAIVESMQGLVEKQRDAFESSMFNSEDELKGAQRDTYTNVLNAISELDFQKPADDFATKSMTAVKDATNQLDYDSYAQLFVGKSGAAILSNTQLFEDSNKLVANEGAAAFSQEYRDYLTENQDILSTMDETGKLYGGSLVEGLNQKIEEDSRTTEPFILDWFTKINDFIHDNPIMPFGSPNQKTIEYGEDLVEGLNKGIDNKVADGSVGRAVISLFTKVNSIIKEQIDTVKTTLSTSLNTMLSGLDVTTPITNIFTKVTLAVTNNVALLGENLMSNILPTFIQTYIFPFFNVDMWQPLFDNLFNMVFMPMFEQFRTWFSESMTAWWEEDLLIWFDEGKWDEDIFTPLRESFQDHWDTFSSWWDTTMNEWWENQVKPWFAKELWKEQLTHILDVTKEVFDLIKEAIQIRINEAGEAVAAACETMMQAIEDVMNAIDDMMDKLGSFEGFEGKITFDFGADAFATGGFPSKGSLFWASETGAGAEMVGTVGGKTGVVSNGEITGIADAIYSTGGTESQLLAQLIQIGQAMLNKDPIVLSDKDIARMNNSGQNKLGMSIIS